VVPSFELDRLEHAADPAGIAVCATHAPGHPRGVCALAWGYFPGMTGMEADTIFTAPVLIVRQKTKLIEVSNEYTIHDPQGELIADVRQVGQALAQKALRFLGTPADRLLTFRLKVSDRDGNVLLMLTRPAKLVKSRLVVHDGEGNELGHILQENALGQKSFSLQADGEELGKVVGKDWASWEFVVQDRLGTDIAHLTNTLDGLSMLDLLSDGMNDTFSSADSYAVEILQPIDQPLRSLVVAAALAIDVALHQE
jgi:uncharacterized protein YxjI